MSTAQFIRNTLDKVLYEKDKHLISKLTQKDFIRIKEIIKEDCKEYAKIEKNLDINLPISLLVPYLEKQVVTQLLKELKVLLKNNLQEKKEVYEINFIYWGFLMQNLLWFEQIEKSEFNTNLPV